MKKILSQLLTGSFIGLLAFSNPSPCDAFQIKDAGEPKQPITTLTRKELESFQKVTEKYISLEYHWRAHSILCDQGEINVYEKYRKHQGRIMNVHLVVARKHVFAYFHDFHFKIDYYREESMGLIPIFGLQKYCKKSLKEAKEWFKFDKEYFHNDPIQETSVNYLVTGIIPIKVEPESQWSPKKKQIYERMKTVIKESLKDYCKDGKRFNVIMAHFDGDDLYVNNFDAQFLVEDNMSTDVMFNIIGFGKSGKIITPVLQTYYRSIERAPSEYYRAGYREGIKRIRRYQEARFSFDCKDK